MRIQLMRAARAPYDQSTRAATPRLYTSRLADGWVMELWVFGRVFTWAIQRARFARPLAR